MNEGNPYENLRTVADQTAKQIDACISALDQQAESTPARELDSIVDRLSEARMYCERIISKADDPTVTETEKDEDEDQQPGVKDAAEAGTTEDPATEQPDNNPEAFEDEDTSEDVKESAEAAKEESADTAKENADVKGSERAKEEEKRGSGVS